jgi:predicted O-methyltransferase YrrM
MTECIKHKPVWVTLEEVVEGVHGWLPVDQLYTLFQLAYLTSDLPGDIVEIGSWCGRSSLVLGLAAKLTGDTHVHCIDLFPEKEDWEQNSDGTYSFNVTIGSLTLGGHQKQTVWKEPFERDIVPVYEQHHSILEVFIANVEQHQLQDVIIPFKGNSDMFAQSLDDDFQCRLVFIDGEHSYDAVRRDISSMAGFLVPGGWICFDDAFSTYDGVDRAVEECIINNADFDLCQQMTRKFFIARKKR